MHVKSDKVISRLRAARKNARKTQSELAREAGVDQATISDLERGRIKSPSWDTVKNISDALGEPPEDIFPVQKPSESAIA